MLNYIWLGLVLAGVLLGALTGRLGEVATGAIDMTKLAVMDIALPLAGVMALWLGLMRLAERSGLVLILARVLRPAMRRLFPDVPSEDPAIGAIVMNMAANMLGLANAATPLGLRAMQHLERLNPHPGTATNAMCTFLALNTSSVQLIPATVVAILAAAGSTNPTAVIGPAFVATLCSTIAAVIAVKFLEKLPVYRLPAAPAPTAEDVKMAVAAAAEEEEVLPDNPPPLQWWGMLILLAFLAVMAVAAVQLVVNPAGDISSNPVARVVSAISTLAIPFLLAFFPLYACLRRVPVYEEFVDGAKEGFQVAVRIIPFLVAILVAIGMFRAAGGIDYMARALGPLLNVVGFPVELLPMVLIRPLSGSGATGLFTDVVANNGPDSLAAMMGGSIMGSTETTFYVIAVYFGSVAVRRTRHAVPAGLIADATGVIASLVVCRLLFA
ncbi:MAG: nucleoside recognition domain-containing protein [Chthoniobacterales bacterium]